MDPDRGGDLDRRRCPLCGVLTGDQLCPADGTRTLLADPPRHDLGTIRPGLEIAGRYRIERLVGSGGFSRVYAARHVTTGAEVAVKILSHSGEEAVVSQQRFFREARVLGRLESPHTVRVLDFGQDDQGWVYLVTELLRGTTLAQALRSRLAEGRVFDQEEVISIAAAITRSLGEAHALGLVHRDLKPENVVMHQVLGEQPIVKVLDFGIAKLRDSTLTRPGAAPCTAEYASPEVAAADPTIDGRSDLYSLALVSWALLTGALPFRGANALATLYMQVHQPLPDVRSHARTPVSDALASVIARAAKKAISERYADAAEMRAALEACRGPAGVDLASKTDLDVALPQSILEALAPAASPPVAAAPETVAKRIPPPQATKADRVPKSERPTHIPVDPGMLVSEGPTKLARVPYDTLREGDVDDSTWRARVVDDTTWRSELPDDTKLLPAEAPVARPEAQMLSVAPSSTLLPDPASTLRPGVDRTAPLLPDPRGLPPRVVRASVALLVVLALAAGVALALRGSSESPAEVSRIEPPEEPAPRALEVKRAPAAPVTPGPSGGSPPAAGPPPRAPRAPEPPRRTGPPKERGRDQSQKAPSVLDVEL